jgi:hypothetical protein
MNSPPHNLWKHGNLVLTGINILMVLATLRHLKVIGMLGRTSQGAAPDRGHACLQAVLALPPAGFALLLVVTLTLLIGKNRLHPQSALALNVLWLVANSFLLCQLFALLR